MLLKINGWVRAEGGCSQVPVFIRVNPSVLQGEALAKSVLNDTREASETKANPRGEHD